MILRFSRQLQGAKAMADLGEGMAGHVIVSHNPLDIAKLIADLDEAAGNGAGAVAHFIGRVRDTSGDLESMTLEQFPGMTQRALSDIAAKAIKRFNLNAATVVHRYGRMEVGEPIVFVGAASAHRQDALDALSYMMDYLKTDAPFWKCEERAGKRQWVDARDSDTAAKARWAR